MDKQKNDGKLIVSVLMVCFAVTIGVMIFALCRPNDKKVQNLPHRLLKAQHSMASLRFRKI